MSDNVNDPELQKFQESEALAAGQAGSNLDLSNEALGTPLYARIAEVPVPRPDITPAQIVGMIPLVAEAAHAFGVFDMSGAQQGSLSKLVIGAIALFGADAVIRFGRNLAARAHL